MNMSDIAVRAEILGKKYPLKQYRGPRELRETLVSAWGRMFSKPADPIAGTALNREHWALRNASFEMRRGEVVALLGSNGAGKTTLLRILARITEPTEGSAEIRGRVLPLLDVGAGFHSQLTGTENVYVHGAILGMKKDEIRRKFDEIVAFAGVETFLSMPIKRWSRGMCVRLAFAVAVHADADVLLVDELLDVTDTEFREQCTQRIADSAIREGRAVMFVSHDLTYARRLCTRQLQFAGGRIVEDSARVEVSTREPACGSFCG
jgi:lipopolysaccharide transport system ATP-binding protein